MDIRAHRREFGILFARHKPPHTGYREESYGNLARAVNDVLRSDEPQTLRRKVYESELALVRVLVLLQSCRSGEACSVTIPNTPLSRSSIFFSAVVQKRTNVARENDGLMTDSEWATYCKDL